MKIAKQIHALSKRGSANKISREATASQLKPIGHFVRTIPSTFAAHQDLAHAPENPSSVPRMGAGGRHKLAHLMHADA